MTPGARVQAAIELLDDILQGRPAEQALTGWARRGRFAGSKDRAAIRDHVYQALRGKRSYAALGGAESGRGIMIGALRAMGADLSDLFSGIGHAPAPLSVSETSAGAPAQSVGAQMDLQDWMVPHFVASLGGQAEAERTAAALRDRAPVMLRVNLRKSDVQKSIAALAREGIGAVAIPGSDTALHVVEGARRIASCGVYRDGLVELQDGSSQAAMEMLNISPGAKVLDYCAGGGGKILALAAGNEARWYAHDALPQRLKDLPERAARAGVSVSILEHEVAHAQTFDLVLCDVPCSGSGTWRRTPDAKWRLTEPDLQALNATQDEILECASRLVKPQGVLAYATCSVFACENEDRIDAFLATQTGWQNLQQNRWQVSERGDGFFLAQLKRN